MASKRKIGRPAAPGVIAWGAAGALGGMVGGWIAGNIVCFVFDLFVSRGNAAYAYLTWLLVAAIAGFLCMSVAGERAAPPPEGKPSWIYRPDAVRIAWLLVAGGVLAIVVAGLLCRQFLWDDWGDDYYVPWSKPHSIAFLIGILLGLFGSRQMAAMEQAPGPPSAS